MTEESRPPIQLSVHESADPSEISPNSETEPSGELSDRNDSVHDDENVDVPTPGLPDTSDSKTIADDQINIVNRSAG